MGAGSSSCPSAASSKAANAYCTLFSPHPVIRRALGSDKVLEWALLDENGAHTVRLEHDIFSGRRLILVDDTVVFERPRMLIDGGSKHAFNVGRSLRCVVSIIDQGLQFGYSLHINEQSFPRFRQEFWRYAALYYLPKSGVLPAGDAQWPSPTAADAANAASASVAPSPSLAAVGASRADASSVPCTPSPSPSPCPPCSSDPFASSPSCDSSMSHFHTVVVLSSPQLTVLLNGRVVELESSFSGVDEGGSGAGGGASEPEDSTKHKFMAPREFPDSDDDEDDTFSDVRPVHVRAESASMAAAAARLALLTHPRSATCGIECELTAWLEKEPPLPAGAVVSAVPRDKKRPMRFALRVDGQLLAQAPSPLVSVHSSLRKGSHSVGTGGDGVNNESNSSSGSVGSVGSVSDGISNVSPGKSSSSSSTRPLWQASTSSVCGGSGGAPRALSGPSHTPNVVSSSGSRGNVTPTSVAAAAAAAHSHWHSTAASTEDVSDFGLLPIHAATAATTATK